MLPGSTFFHRASPGASTHAATFFTSASPTAFSRLGTPPRAMSGIVVSPFFKYTVSFNAGDAVCASARTLDSTNGAFSIDPNAPCTTMSPPPASSGDRACSRITSPTPSSAAITAIPRPNPHASTAVRMGRTANDRIASFRTI